MNEMQGKAGTGIEQMAPDIVSDEPRGPCDERTSMTDRTDTRTTTGELSNARYPEKYGSWAGNSEGKSPNYALCCETVSRPVGRWTSFGQCSRKRGFGPDKAYCKTHDPEAVKARREKVDEASRAKWSAERYSWYGKTFFNALKQIAEGHNDPRALAKETIGDFLKVELPPPPSPDKEPAP